MNLSKIKFPHMYLMSKTNTNTFSLLITNDVLWEYTIEGWFKLRMHWGPWPGLRLIIISYKLWKETNNKWAKVLDHILNVTLTLVASTLGFKGHKEKLQQPNRRNILAIIDFLSKYDALLQEIISDPKNREKYMSPKIQN